MHERLTLLKPTFPDSVQKLDELPEPEKLPPLLPYPVLDDEDDEWAESTAE